MSDNINFIKRANEIHGNRYDYSKVKYVNNKTKVCIICPEHGEFWQRPDVHLKGCGCKKCVQKKLSNSDIFVENAKKIHGDKYDYSKVEYKDSKTKVYIICPKHGGFWQKPYNHLRGRGCSLCKESSLEKEIRCFLEKNKINFLYQYKMPWLGKQSLDFYLPDYNVAIECQGEQHYNPIDFSNSKNNQKADKKLLYTQKLDKKKMKKCLQNHCTLIYYTKEEFANNGEFYDINKLKVYLDGIVSIDDGSTLRKYMDEHNIPVCLITTFLHELYK